MRPALTAAEWARGGVQRGDWEEGPGTHKGLPCLFTEGGAGTWTFDPFEAHQMAALCLHNQEFGFTHEDVFLLRYEAEHWEESVEKRLGELADRIEALLPPEEP